MQDDDFNKPITRQFFTQFVPGHAPEGLGANGGTGNRSPRRGGQGIHTIAVDDGIAMGHGGMLIAPSRKSSPMRWNTWSAHCADALVCISNCDKITGSWNAAMRLNIPVVLSGGPMESGKALIKAKPSNWWMPWFGRQSERNR
ncbi:MAG: dihydroxy-acid dehydratase [Thiolinea sp.]